MKIIAIIQARTGSHRLPGKVLQLIDGKPMLTQVIQRLTPVPELDKVVVATTNNECDNPVVELCQGMNIDVFRGSEQDVLDRFYQCASSFQADVVVRITADCPLLDAEVVSCVIQKFLQQQADYASNCLQRTYPRGLDVEVMTFETLQTTWQQATEIYQREHVTPYIYQNPKQFTLFSVVSNIDYSDYRWTVDEKVDLEMIRNIYQNFRHQPSFNWQDVIKLLQQQPDIALLNKHIQQKTLVN